MFIYSMGHYFPENILDNQFFDQLDIGSAADWIHDRVGIETRRSVLTPDQIRLLRQRKITREELKGSGQIEFLRARPTALSREVAKKPSPECPPGMSTILIPLSRVLFSLMLKRTGRDIVYSFG